jgi:hypothetical protein
VVRMIDTRAIRLRWEADGSKRDERGKRVFAASEARLAHGLSAFLGVLEGHQSSRRLNGFQLDSTQPRPTWSFPHSRGILPTPWAVAGGFCLNVVRHSPLPLLGEVGHRFLKHGCALLLRLHEFPDAFLPLKPPV